jgi:hypothetical protein
LAAADSLSATAASATALTITAFGSEIT